MLPTMRHFGVLCLCLAFARPASCQPPRLLPPAADFQLTLRELSGPQAAAVPPGPSCSGAAARALACKAFVVTLRNLGTNLVRLAEFTCTGPELKIEQTLHNNTAAWFPISSPRSICKGYQRDAAWSSTRLRPGESLTYTTRLISERRTFEQLFPYDGAIALRATWALLGCTDTNEADNCFTPLNRFSSPASSVPEIDYQTPVLLTSNEIVAEVDHLSGLGTPRFSLEVTALPAVHGAPLPPGAVAPPDPHCPAEARSADCVTFRYVLHNISDLAVRLGMFTCSGDLFTVEYRKNGGPWQALQPAGWVCLRNFYQQRPLLAGKALDGYFTLRSLTPGSDVTPVLDAGTYTFRFTAHPNACVAAPDASFCLEEPKDQPEAISPEITILAAPPASSMPTTPNI